MIFNDLQTAIVNRLLDDAYFTHSPGIPVIAESSNASVASGEIVEGRLYTVRTGTITYDATERVAGESFTASATETFTGSGTVTEDETERQINTALNKVGICLVVSKVKDSTKGQDRGGVNIPIFIEVFENSQVNRSSAGTNKPSDDCCLKAWSNLDYWKPASYFTELEFQGMSEVFSDGCISVWRIGFETSTFTAVVDNVLVNQSNSNLSDQDGNTFQMTPEEA